MLAETVNSNDLPALLRVNDLCNNPKTGTRGVLNCSKSYFYDAVKAGVLPQPIYLGERLPLWKREDIEQVLKHGVKSQAA